MDEYQDALVKATASHVEAWAIDQAGGYCDAMLTAERFAAEAYLQGLVSAGFMLGKLADFDWLAVEIRIAQRVQELCEHECFSTTSHPFEDSGIVETCDNCNKVVFSK